MAMNIRILLFLIMVDLVTAESITSEVIGQAFIIIGIIIGSVFAVAGLIFLLYFTVRCVKRNMREPQYYINETPTVENSEEHHIESEVIDLSSVHPNLSITHIAKSIKQCFIDLRDSLIPFDWSQAQQHIHHPDNSINEKQDFTI